jgi:hypothetical protein
MANLRLLRVIDAADAPDLIKAVDEKGITATLMGDTIKITGALSDDQCEIIDRRLMAFPGIKSGANGAKARRKGRGSLVDGLRLSSVCGSGSSD